MMTLPLLFLTTLSIILGLYPKPFLDLLHQVIGS
jgi:NADH:ubiquinone oxidoreductase subunit 4 (subunit M)